MRLLVATHGRIAAVFGGWAVAVCPLSAFYATGGDFLGDGLNLFILAGVVFRAVYGSGRTAASSPSSAATRSRPSRLGWECSAFGIPLADAIIRGAPRGGDPAGTARAPGRRVRVRGGLLLGARRRACALSSHRRGGGLGGHLDPLQDLQGNARHSHADASHVSVVPGVAALALDPADPLGRRDRADRRPDRGGAREVPANRKAGSWCSSWCPAVAFFVAFTGAFLMHTYAPLVLVPAIGAAAGAFASMLWRLGVLGRVAALGWAGLVRLGGNDRDAREVRRERARRHVRGVDRGRGPVSAGRAPRHVSPGPVGHGVLLPPERRGGRRAPGAAQAANDYVRLPREPRSSTSCRHGPRFHGDFRTRSGRRSTSAIRRSNALSRARHAESVGNWRLYKLQ